MLYFFDGWNNYPHILTISCLFYNKRERWPKSCLNEITHMIRHKRGKIGPSYLLSQHGDPAFLFHFWSIIITVLKKMDKVWNKSCVSFCFEGMTLNHWCYWQRLNFLSAQLRSTFWKSLVENILLDSEETALSLGAI